MNDAAADGSALKRGSIESRDSWKAAWVTLAILSISFGAPLLIVVGMKPMQEALGTERSVLALAGALVWVGTGAGGVLMGWRADRMGVRETVAIAASMMAAGLALSSLGPIWTLYVGQGLMVGLLGNGGIYAPLLVYVSRWFDRRRGTAIALISSGQYIAGVVWPTLFERGIAELGWQPVMRTYAMVVLLAILPATLLLKPAPIAAPPPHARAAAKRGNRVVYADAGRGRPVRHRRRLRVRFQRNHPRLLGRDPRPVFRRRGVVAHSAGALHGHERHGLRQLVCRRPLRSFRLLRAGLRRWPRLQPRQPVDRRIPGLPPDRPAANRLVARHRLKIAIG